VSCSAYRSAGSDARRSAVDEARDGQPSQRVRRGNLTWRATSRPRATSHCASRRRSRPIRNTGSTGRVLVGRQLSLTNLLTPGLRWQITPRSAIDGYLTYGVRRFFGDGIGVTPTNYLLQTTSSYGLNVALDRKHRIRLHVSPQRRRGRLGHAYPDGRLRLPVHADTDRQHQRRSAITIISGETFVSPAGNVSITQVFRAGTINLQYIRGVTVAGASAGPRQPDRGSPRS